MCTWNRLKISLVKLYNRVVAHHTLENLFPSSLRESLRYAAYFYMALFVRGERVK